MEERLAAFAARVASGARVTLLFGAGVSCASGIPDFRSPGGMYATLRPELLTATPAQRDWMSREPTAIVDKALFLSNPLPYHEVRRPFILGTHEGAWRPTLAHSFASALGARGQLRHVLTQNIDGLERRLPFPAGAVVNVHGTIAEAACEGCGRAAEPAAYMDAVRRQIRNIYEPAEGPPASTPILCAGCGAPAVKPTTVLFGGQLPSAFFDAAAADFAPGGAELLIVAGTSLRVFPAASIVPAAEGIPRLVINREPVGAELGFDPAAVATDVLLAADIDAGFLELGRRAGLLGAMRAHAPHLCEASRALLEAACAKRGGGMGA
jgi:NAD-dependent SIR2 family protein deacetylase